jgi:hypothetical protein
MSSQIPIPPLDDDDVLAEEQYVEIPDWHREIIEERLARYDKFGWKGRPWEEFRKELDDFLEELKKSKTSK